MTQATTIQDFRNARCQKLNFNIEEYIAIIIDQNFSFSLAQYTNGKIDGACIAFFPDKKIFYGQIVNNKQQGLCVFFLGNQSYLYTVFKGNEDPSHVIIQFAYMKIIIDIHYSDTKKIQPPVQIAYENDEQKFDIIGKCLGIKFPKHFRKWYLFVQERFDNHYKIPFLERLQDEIKFVGFLKEKETLGIKATKLNQLKQIGCFSKTRDLIGFGSKVIPTLGGDVVQAGNYQDNAPQNRQLIRYQANSARPKQITKVVRKYFFKSLAFKNQYLPNQAIQNVWNYSFEVCISLNDKQTQKYAQLLLENPNEYQRIQPVQIRKTSSKFALNPQKQNQKKRYQDQSKSLQKIRDQLVKTAELRKKSQIQPKKLTSKALAMTPAELSKISPQKSYIRSRSPSRSPTAQNEKKDMSNIKLPSRYNTMNYDITPLKGNQIKKDSPIKKIEFEQSSYFPKNRQRLPTNYSPGYISKREIKKDPSIVTDYSPTTLRDKQEKRRMPGTSYLTNLNNKSPYKQSKTYNNKVDKTYITQEVALNRANKQANEQKINKIQKIYDDMEASQQVPVRNTSKSPSSLSKNHTKPNLFTNYNTDNYTRRTQQPLQQFFLNQYSSTSPITKQINSKRQSSTSPLRKLSKSPSKNNIQTKPQGYLDRYDRRLKYQTKQKSPIDQKRVSFATDHKNVYAYYPEFQALDRKKQMDYEQINKYYDQVQKIGRQRTDIQKPRVKKRQYSYLSGF